MISFEVFTTTNFGPNLYGGTDGFAISKVNPQQLIAVEDFLFREGNEQLRLADSTSSIVALPGFNVTKQTIRDAAIVVEFGLALLVKQGHPRLSAAAIFDGTKCNSAIAYPVSSNYSSDCSFNEKLTGAHAGHWLKRCSSVYRAIGNKFHTTAYRYVRYSRSARDDDDGLLDLCISLESLIESQTEISYRFSTSLAKATGAKGTIAERYADLLSNLYDLRSKVVHGDHKVGKLLEKMRPHTKEIHELSREILTTYVLHVSEYGQDAWKNHLKKSVLS